MTASTQTIRLHRVLKTTPDKIYRAFLDPDLSPHGHWQGLSSEAKVGGTFACPSPTGSLFRRRVFELVPNERIRHRQFDNPISPARCR
jgi:uncharacterized protein YndB with AHSA1/START domain